MTTHRSALLRARIAPTVPFLLVATFLLAMLGTARGEPDGTDEPIGGVEVTWDGKRRVLPMAKSEASVVIRGDLASVHLVQVFENPFSTVVHARYVFPLPPDAAVYAMRMQSGDRMIEAEIRRKPEARAVYEAAKSRGNTAALLDQHRPDVFTQEIANLLPGLPIRVELEYAHPVRKSGWDFEFRLPLVVGPRFLPGASTDADSFFERDAAGAPTGGPGEPEGVAIGRWDLPASSPVAATDRSDEGRVSIDVDLRAGVPIALVESPSHPIAIDPHGDDGG
jgi:Ca-activated chloride channel family protein